MVIGTLYRQIKKTLASARVFSPDFEARQLIMAYTGADPFLSPDKEPDESQYSSLLSALSRRLSGEPLQYILGKWEFCGFEFYVGEGVLIPRPETELVVEEAVAHIKKLGKNKARLLDLCSGTGCIPISAEKLSGAQCFAVELYDKAFSYLEKNKALNSSSVTAVQADALDDSLFGGISFDVITSNPPYLTAEEMDSLSPEVSREPRTALDGGKDGLDFYRKLIPLWSPRLSENGAFIVEVGDAQADDVEKLMKEAGLYARSEKDAGGFRRAVIAGRQI